MSRRKRDPWNIAGNALLVLLALFTLLPMAWMLVTSLKTQFAATIYPPEWWPKNPTLESYVRLLSPDSDVGREFLQYLFNSIWVSLPPQSSESR